MFSPSAMTTYAVARTMSPTTSALGPKASGASAASAIRAAAVPARRSRRRRSISGSRRRAMGVRGLGHRAPLRVAAGVRLAHAARPLGGPEGVDPPGQDRRADAVERRAILGVERIHLRAQDREAGVGDLAREG